MQAQDLKYVYETLTYEAYAIIKFNRKENINESFYYYMKKLHNA